MTIQEFIEKAIEGGWTMTKYYPDAEDMAESQISHILLDPEAWKAVGKVEGWWESIESENFDPETYWLKQMHRMIDALAEGKTLKEFIATL